MSYLPQLYNISKAITFHYCFHSFASCVVIDIGLSQMI